MMMLKKVPPKSALVEAVTSTAAEREAAVAKLEAEIEDLYEGYFARVHKIINSRGFASKTEAVNLQSTIAMIDKLSDILVESGFEDVIAEYLDVYPLLTRQALEYFEPFGLPPSLAGVDEATLHAWVAFGQSELAQTIESQLIDPIQSALLQVNFGNQTRDEVIERVIELSENTTTARATTLVNESFAQYQRGVTIQKAEALGLEIYQYLGPLDGITSDQCEEMLTVNRHGVPGMLYKEEITIDLHPDLVSNPLVAGGHPNCRHQWSPVSESYASSLGFELRKEAA